MKTKFFLWFMVMALMITAGLVFLSQPPKASVRSTEKVTTPVVQIDRSVKRPQALPNPAALGISKECQALWASLNGLDLSQVSPADQRNRMINPVMTDAKGFGEKLHPVLGLPHCSGLPDKTLESINDSFYSLCETVDKSGQFTGADGYACFFQTLRYRFAIAGYSSKDTPLDEISDIGLLSNRLYSQLFEGQKPSDVAETAERILALEPNNADADAQSLRARYLDWVVQAETATGPQRDSLDKAIEAMAALSDGDKELPKFALTRLEFWATSTK